jgi:hypothetical protein
MKTTIHDLFQKLGIQDGIPVTGEQFEQFLNYPMATEPTMEEYYREKISIGIRTLFQSADTLEVRSWDGQHNIYTGRYIYGDGVVEALQIMDEAGCDCYYVLNPVGTSLPLRTLAAGGVCTSEEAIPFRRWFLLDFDPLRTNKIACEEEYQAALIQAVAAKVWLESVGFDQVVLASSGNGAHLLVRCELPNDKASKQLINTTQRVIACKYSTPKVECECFCDGNRLVRAYGTVNKKGLETAERKYRRSGTCQRF